MNEESKRANREKREGSQGVYEHSIMIDLVKIAWHGSAVWRSVL
jgi:hypothetical protein